MTATDWQDEDFYNKPPNPWAYVGKPGYGKGRVWWKRTTTWTTQTGVVIKLPELSDSHLTAILAFLHRKAMRERSRAHLKILSVAAHVSGEHATDAIESALDDLESGSVETDLAELPIYRALVREADRRMALEGLYPTPGMTVFS